MCTVRKWFSSFLRAAVIVSAYALTFAQSSRARAADAECPPSNPLGDEYCMDTNGDGRADIADAVNLLQYLFAGGANRCGHCSQQDPAVLARVAQLLASLEAMRDIPDTGAERCYDWEGNVINCDHADFPGQDAFYGPGPTHPPRFIDNRDGTVSDLRTALMWQKGPADANGDGVITDDRPYNDSGPDQTTWGEALRHCDSLILTTDNQWVGRKPTETPSEFEARKSLVTPEMIKYDDWRLPNILELQSIVDFGRSNTSIDPAFDVTQYFTDPTTGDLSLTHVYWTSTTSDAYPERVWMIGFAAGSARIGDFSWRRKDGSYHEVDLDKTAHLFFRAVRTMRPEEMPIGQ